MTANADMFTTYLLSKGNTGHKGKNIVVFFLNLKLTKQSNVFIMH